MSRRRDIPSSNPACSSAITIVVKMCVHKRHINLTTFLLFTYPPRCMHPSTFTGSCSLQRNCRKLDEKICVLNAIVRFVFTRLFLEENAVRQLTESKLLRLPVNGVLSSWTMWSEQDRSDAHRRDPTLLLPCHNPQRGSVVGDGQNQSFSLFSAQNTVSGAGKRGDISSFSPP